jgi:hypothetical protein
MDLFCKNRYGPSAMMPFPHLAYIGKGNSLFANKTRVLRRTRKGNCACLRQADSSILRGVIRLCRLHSDGRKSEN